jgi:hypothetical protein
MIHEGLHPLGAIAMSRVRISATNLWTYRITDSGTEREPLSQLGASKNVGHVHGELRIEIDGRAVPHLGYFGPHDACLNTWLKELCNVVNALAAAPGAYTFDEGEQGQPAFAFERVGDDVALSICDSALADGEADPEWQKVTFPYADFRAAVLGLLDDLRAELVREAPTAWKHWWQSAARLD